MRREHYFTVEGPKGKVEIYEVTDDSPASQQAFEPNYEIEYDGKAERYVSEGEAITVAQQLVGSQSSW